MIRGLINKECEHISAYINSSCDLKGGIASSRIKLIYLQKKTNSLTLVLDPRDVLKKTIDKATLL